MLGNRYRRYRYENRYDAPFKIMLIDALISVSKLVVVLLVLFAAWLGVQHLLSESRQKGLETASTVMPQAIASGAGDESFTHQTALALDVAENSSDTDATNIVITDDTRDLAVNKQAVDKQAVEKPADVAMTASGVVGEKWILAQQSSSFILQFGSSLDDIELIREFVPIIESDQPIAVFQFKRTTSGETVYGIASGVFDDLESALESIELLTEAERRYDPWVRPLGEIQRQVSAMVNSSSG